MASAWVVGFEEGAVHKTLGDCKSKEDKEQKVNYGASSQFEVEE